MYLGKYSDDQLDNMYLNLSDDKKEVLDNHVRRGKKTQWLNILAKKKGAVLTQAELDDPEETMKQLLDWELTDYVDALKVDPELKCDCGRSLRYRYTVLHKETGQVHHFGINHFEQHTKLDPQTVRDVLKSFKSIDLEREEILTKALDGWKLPFNIPNDLEIPKDMVEQIRVDLPLLERQEDRLKRDIAIKYRSSQPSHSFPRHQRIVQPLPPRPTPKPTLTFNDKRLNEYNTYIHQDVTESIPDVSDVDPVSLHQKLLYLSITSAEARKLYYFLRRHRQDLEDYGLTIDMFINCSMKALGKIGDPLIRSWLIEIKDLR